MPELKLKVLDPSGRTLAASPCGETVSLVYANAYRDGDWIALETDTAGLHCVIQLEDTMPPALVYLPGRALRYPIPPAGDRCNYSPKSFSGGIHLLRARAARPEEITARRNLAFDPYDSHENDSFYPHATANVETRNEAVFAARNAIDGILENRAHGEWPYQSWGINRDPNACLKLHFGRPVCVDELRLTLRADFPHDSWWTQATARFSDGSQAVLPLQKQAAPQSFPLAPRTVEWLELCDLIKAPDASPFPALIQIEVYGLDDSQ